MNCACCGRTGGDIKLKNCTACCLVRYCGVKCQKDHRPHHKKECKKRAAELRDELLFKQPESTHLGDCPICCLPIPIDMKKSVIYNCCYRLICLGCYYANMISEQEGRRHSICPFCREPATMTDDENKKRQIKRIEVNDPVALRHEGVEQYHKGEYFKTFELYTKAANLGDAEAHYRLGLMYGIGLGVERDGEKNIYHLEEAAIGGHPAARWNLGIIEEENGNSERAVKHLIIAAYLGNDEAIKSLTEMYKQGTGLVSKDDFAAALRAQQAAVDATKSLQREEASKKIDS
eukprot:scaffold6874_cov74-Skeletonema_dohrnii-CCMP3373.AAC.3